MKVRKKQKFIENLKLVNGQMAKACALTGISHMTYYRWQEKFPSFRDEVNEIKAHINDHVETQLFKNINGGNVGAQIFFLKTHHPEYKDEHPVVIERMQINQVKLTNDQIDRFIARRYGVESSIPEVLSGSIEGEPA